MAAAATMNNILSPKTKCITASKRSCTRIILSALTLIICLSIVVGAYMYFQPVAFTHPGFDHSAISGTPVVGAEYGFSTLKVNDSYSIQLCGLPEVDDQEVYLYLTNPDNNDVWFRADIHDANGNVLGSTGVLKQGEYIPSIHLDTPLNSNESSVTVRVIGYEPNTWHSAGNVSLRMSLQTEDD